jgi:hypothetical protein
MKRKAILALFTAAIMLIGAVAVFALDYAVPEDSDSVTARFTILEVDEAGEEFSMICEDGEMIIHITNNTLVYFEDFVPLSDECDGMTQMAREVLFGRTLAEVLDNRNMRVVFVDGDEIEAISVMILFEIAVHLPETIGGEYMGIMTLPGDISGEYAGFETLPGYIEAGWDESDLPTLNGETVVNNVIIEDAPAPFWYEAEHGGVLMVALRPVAQALDFDVSWNGYLQSIQLGVAIHLWIGNTEVHFGRMAPLEISAAPMIVDGVTFVPIDFFRTVLNQTAYVFEGQVVVESYSDMF